MMQELLVSPYMLLQNNIPVVRCVQRPGEFIINYPGEQQLTLVDLHDMIPAWQVSTSSWASPCMIQLLL